MHSLGVRIFMAYWVTTAIVITIANMINPEQLRRPELIRQAVRTSLALNGQILARDYESGGCTALKQDFPSGDKHIYLASSDGQFLCDEPNVSNIESLVTKTRINGNLASKRYGFFQLVALSISSMSGRPYLVFLKSPYSSPMQFFGWLPGITTFAISGVVTIVLAFLLTWPIRTLRSAARQIATGNLAARVSWAGLSGRMKFGKKDEIQGLMDDFNEMAARLQALVDAQRLLLRDVSHELRSPLSRLNVALELGREEASGTMHIHLDRIEREALRLNNLISQLMALSYMETIHEVAQPENLSLNQLITDLLPDVQYEAAGRKCHITATVVRNCVVRGDAELLQRALENIIRNAIHYTPEDGVVKIDLDTGESNGKRCAVLSVSDDGPGVPENELEAILRPFYRVDKSRQSSTGGFGIGLAIADRAVHLHDGKLLARNSRDGGLTVEMHFPLAVPI
jgi:two-component system, OmpR family, sensor histidine kinase CpxA